MKSFTISRYCNNNNNNALNKNYSLLKKFFCNKAKEKSNQQWNAVIGLEVHAQISSKSKLFSGSNTEYGNQVNSNVSFFDCATPGTLPVLNRRCVEAGVMTALALSCKINEVSLFDRKHYFYADLPAGYQITQQRQPLAVDGEIKFNYVLPENRNKTYNKSCKLKQIQLEQDSGKTLYDDFAGRNLIDLNRAGVPLMEFVFEPDLSDAEEAAALIKELTLILQRLNTCSCKMEEGAFRVDANVSINKPHEPLGIRTEIKNIGSVRGVASAIKYEIRRQIKIREKGEMIVNETRAWDAISNKTISMRDKEEKQDYRFMPEPNLPPLHIHTNKNKKNEYNLVDATFLETQLPEMPEETREKLRTKYEVHEALIIVLVNEPDLLNLFNYIMKDNQKRCAQLVAKVLVYQLLEVLYDHKLTINYSNTIREHIAQLLDFLQEGKINLLVFEKVLEEIIKDPKTFPDQIIEKNNWIQITDEEEIRKICQDLIDKNPDLVKKYKSGKKTLFKYFMKQIVASTNNRCNMKTASQMMEKMLE